MNRRAKLIAVAALAALVSLTCAVVLALEDDDEDSERLAPTVATAPGPAPERCPPPGPAAVDPRTGRTLCGEEAKRFVEREQQRRREELYPDASELRQGRRIIRSDPTVSAILRGHRYRIAQLGPWSAGGGGSELLGVAAQVEVDQPIEVDAVVPYVCHGDPAKGSGRQRVRAGNVTQLHVLAQLRTRRVVEILPEGTPGGPELSDYQAERLQGSDECPPSEYED